MMSRALWECWLLPRNAAIVLMQAYRRVISPLYGPVCRYHPSCSRYALEAFQSRGFTIGFLLSAWRLLRCTPFTPGGIDDVPGPQHRGFTTSSRGFVRPTARKA